MAGPAATGGIGIQLDSGDWYLLVQQLKMFDPALVTALRKRLRSAGDFAVRDIQRTLRLPSPDGGPDTKALRDILAMSTKVSISFSRRQAGVSVKTSSNRLPPEHQPVMKTYNLDRFRHPVFGNDEAWVTQRGRPYFGSEFQQMFLSRARQEVYDAIADATATLERLYRG